MLFWFNVNIRFFLLVEEVEMYKNYKEDFSMFVLEDQFMMKVILNRQYKKEIFFFLILIFILVKIMKNQYVKKILIFKIESFLFFFVRDLQGREIDELLILGVGWVEDLLF